MCNCGCNTCETKGPLLTEGKVKSLLSEGLQYHINKKIPLFETIYRIGSDKHLALIKEARKMYSRNIISLCEEDEALIGTHLGEFALYEGESVPLDLPMLEAEIDYEKEKTWRIQDKFPIEVTVKKGWTGKYYTIEPKPMDISYDAFINLGTDGTVDYNSYDYTTGEAVWTSNSLEQIKQWEKDNQDKIKVVYSNSLNESKYWEEESIQQTIDRLKARLDDPNDGMNTSFIRQKIKKLEKSLEEVTRYSGFDRNPEDPDSEPFNPTGAVSKFREELRTLFGKFKGNLKSPDFIRGVAEIMVNWKSLLRSQLNESKIPTQDQVDKFFALTQNETHYLNSKPVAGQEKTFNQIKVEPWDEYDLSNWKSLVRKAKSKGKINEARKYNQEELLRLDLIARRKFNCDYEKCTDEQKSEVLKDKIKVGVKEALQVVKKEIGEAEMKEDGFPDKFTSDADIVYLKMKEDSRGAHYNLYYKGYDIEFGGIRFGTVKSLMDYSLQRIVSRQTADKLRFEDAKPLPTLDEAEFKGKEVALNKPKRGGSKAYYVYVRDPKTKKVKKVSFGSGGLRAKIKNKEARNAFAARHNCKNKKDRTKAGYWSCNLPRYAKVLGLGANMNTFW